MNDLFFNKLDEDSTKYKKLLIEGDDENKNEDGSKNAPPKPLFPMGIDILPKRERRLQVVPE